MIRLPSIQESAQAALNIIESAGKSWLDKIVRNPRTGRKVQVRNLPEDLRNRYRPKKEKTREEKPPKSAKVHDEIQVEKGSPVDYNDGKTPKSHPELFPKAADGKHYRLARIIPKNPKLKPGQKSGSGVSYGKPEFNKDWSKDPAKSWYCRVPKEHLEPTLIKEKNFDDKEKLMKAKKRYAEQMERYNAYRKRMKATGKTPYEYVYTTNHFIKHGRTKFLGIQNVMKKWKDLNNLNAEHRKKSLPGSKDFAAACIFAVQLQTAARIGTKGNEERGVFGAHSLQRRHMTFKKGDLELDYIGKDRVEQHHVITDKGLIRNIRTLWDKTKNPKDPVLTWEKAGTTRLVDPDDINGRTDDKGNIIRPGYLQQFRDKLGLEMTSHHVRHVWAAKIFSTEASQIDRKKVKVEFKDGRPTKQALDAVNEAFLTCANAVAKKLGNKPKASIDNYIDPTLITGFWNDFGIKPEHYPKSLKTRIAKANDLLFAHLVMSELPKESVFEDAYIKNFSDFQEFLNGIDFTDIPDTPEEMAKHELQLWI